MLNPTVIETKLAGLVGFRQPYNPAYAVIDAANLLSTSGYFITDNPYVKIETIKDCQDYQAISDADFNKYLRDKIKASTVAVGNAVFNQTDLIDRQILYTNATNKIATDDLPSGFVCYMLRASCEKDVAFTISRIFLEFQGTGDIILKLYNSANMTAALQTKTISVTGPFMEVDLGWTCDNSTAGKGYKGDYFLGFFSQGVTLKPYKRSYESSVVMSTVKEMYIEALNIADFNTTADACDLTKKGAKIDYIGINPDITVYSDYTDLMVQNQKLFARAIMLDVQISLLTEIAASIRSNRVERLGTQYLAQVIAQIEGEDSPGAVKVTGLKKQFFGSLKNIRSEIVKLQDGYQPQRQIMVETLS